MNHVTFRQKQVLEMLSFGASNASIAAALNVSVGTVKLEIALCMAAHGAKNRTHLAALHYREKILGQLAKTHTAASAKLPPR